jgi:hypothetical protein
LHVLRFPGLCYGSQVSELSPDPSTLQLHTLITGTLWVTFSFMLTIFDIFFMLHYGSRQVARLMATTSFGFSARRAEQCVLSSDCFLFLCFGYDQVTELASIVDVSYHPCPSRQSFFHCHFSFTIVCYWHSGRASGFPLPTW